MAVRERPRTLINLLLDEERFVCFRVCLDRVMAFNYWAPLLTLYYIYTRRTAGHQGMEFMIKSAYSGI